MASSVGGYRREAPGRTDSNRIVGKTNNSLGNVIIKSEEVSSMSSRHSETPSRSSPDSSTLDDYSITAVNNNSSPLRCPQCPVLCADEPSLTDHLLRVHRARLLKSEVPTTRCPVCRQLVTDLSHHFAMEHSEKKSANMAGSNNNNNNNNSIRREDKLIVTSSRNSPPFVQLTNAAAAVDAARVIPIFLPSHPLPESQLGARSDSAMSAEEPVSPMNLSLRRSSDAEVVKMEAKPDLGPTTTTAVSVNIINGSESRRISNNNNNSFEHLRQPSRSAEDSEDFEETTSNFSGEFPSLSADRKRRKQTHVPNESKDDKYWARRMKNNEAAKRSRDMRIRREKVVFEENARLEQDNRELRTELDRVMTENKELHLKMGLILDENARLKNIIYSMQQQQHNGESEEQT